MKKLSKAVLASVVSISAVMLVACGGGGAATRAGDFVSGPASTTSTISTTVATTTTTSLPLGATVTTLQVESTGAGTQSNVPVTFGQVFAEGEIGANQSVTGTLGDGTPLGLQIDAKARHADGSLRHAVISAVLPQLAAGQAQTIRLVKTPAYTAVSSSTALTDLLNAGLSARVNITIGGTAYSVAAEDLLRNGTITNWLSGPYVNEWLVSAPLKTAGGAAHPHLAARFSIRAYKGLNKARVDVAIENNWTFVPGIQNLVYDVQILVGGQTVYSKTALEHYHHARWRKIFWWGGEPAAHIKHNIAYLLATKAVPNYDQSLVVPESTLAGLNTLWLGSNTEPMGGASGSPGMVASYMPTAGGRPDIGPLPRWAVLYLLSMDRRAKSATLGVGDQAGSWPIHYRDEATGFPVRLDNAINRDISIHPNANSSGPLPVPRCVNAASFAAPCDTHNLIADSAHQPSLAYVPYLVTGDYYYLEELQFWAAYNPLETGGGFRAYEKGLTNWQQIRGQAWSLRTMGQVAYITPDDHYLKAYLLQQLNYSIDFYRQAFVVGNPNPLGVLDGSGANSFASDYYIQPWQDDFFTWSSGYLNELGFATARDLFFWKAKFPVGRMDTANTGYCWIDAATQALIIRAGNAITGATYPSLLLAYQNTFSNTDAFVNNIRTSNGDVVTGAAGTVYENTPYLNYACGSQAQADWRGFQLGQMTGFANSPIGTPAILGTALAMAADSTLGVPNAQTAWNQYLARGGVKPNFAADPQWALVPR